MACLVALALLTGDAAARAEPATAAGARAGTPAAERIEARADKLNYDRELGTIEGVGNVVIVKGRERLTADYVKISEKTEEVEAFGAVTLTRGDEVWHGESLHYNFRTHTGDTEAVTASAAPFHIEAAQTVRQPNDTYVLYDAFITTCTNPMARAHYRIKARKVIVVPDDYVEARGAVLYAGKLPILYMPYWHRPLDSDFGFDFLAGYNSRMGGFLLSSCRYRLNPWVKGRTHLDYRSRRGVGIGQDIKWRDAEQHKWSGSMDAYYTHDRVPIEDDEDPTVKDVDNSRYRLRADHSFSFTDRDYVLMQAAYLSDSDILEDFFEDDYRYGSQPENYVSYTHRGDDYTASLILRARLNDFYTQVNRLPEASVTFLDRQIGDTRLYYDGQSAAANLEKTWARDLDAEDYSVFRIDSEHNVYYPDKYLGFLNVVPRVGFRATHYSKTLEAEGSPTNFVASGSGLRSLMEFGVGTSFKAFRTWEHNGAPRRHIVEPHADYTLVPEPSLIPDELYQFDSVDALDKENRIKLGVRNKIQKKLKGAPFDLIDVDVYTYYDFDPDVDESAIRYFYVDADTRPRDWLLVNFDGIYDSDTSEVSAFNTQLYLVHALWWRVTMEYRYTVDYSSVVSLETTSPESRPWVLNGYVRHEFEESQLEEIGGYLQRNLDCLKIRTGVNLIPSYTSSDGSQRDDEWQVSLAVWLTAFPNVGVGRHDH